MAAMTAPCTAAYPPTPCPCPVPEGSRTVFAHRGASALAPENTLAAFRQAGGVGAGSWFTAADGSHPFGGEPVPTLRAALEVVAEAGMGVNVELKSCEAGAEASRRLVDGVAVLLDEYAEELFSWGVTGIFTDRVHELGSLAAQG